MNINRSRLLGCTIVLASTGALCLILIVSAIIGVYVMVVKFRYDYEHGLNYKGASKKYSIAMKEGNGPEAVHWAKKMNEMRHRDYGYVAYALELNGEYDEALKDFESGRANQHCKLNIERVKYKLGREDEAFRGYCRYADLCLEQNQKDLNASRVENQRMTQRISASLQRTEALCYIRRGITMENDRFMRLSPFLEYKDFLDFMEEEYQKLGEPPEYAAAMQLFRAIDTEIDESHLPRSGASDRLDAMREQILAERKAKGVKW